MLIIPKLIDVMQEKRKCANPCPRNLHTKPLIFCFYRCDHDIFQLASRLSRNDIFNLASLHFGDIFQVHQDIHVSVLNGHDGI